MSNDTDEILFIFTNEKQKQLIQLQGTPPEESAVYLPARPVPPRRPIALGGTVNEFPLYACLNDLVHICHQRAVNHSRGGVTRVFTFLGKSRAPVELASRARETAPRRGVSSGARGGTTGGGGGVAGGAGGHPGAAGSPVHRNRRRTGNKECRICRPRRFRASPPSLPLRGKWNAVRRGIPLESASIPGRLPERRRRAILARRDPARRLYLYRSLRSLGGR